MLKFDIRFNSGSKRVTKATGNRKMLRHKIKMGNKTI